MDCKHQRDSFFGRMLRSCRECEVEKDPSLMDRAVAAWAITQLARTGHITSEDAEHQVRELYA